jgi:hypothetical protein
MLVEEMTTCDHDQDAKGFESPEKNTSTGSRTISCTLWAGPFTGGRMLSRMISSQVGGGLLGQW